MYNIKCSEDVNTYFEPTRAKPNRFQVCPVNHSGKLSLEPLCGIEPQTFALQVRCTTTVLLRLLVLPGFEPGMSESKSEVLTSTLKDTGTSATSCTWCTASYEPRKVKKKLSWMSSARCLFFFLCVGANDGVRTRAAVPSQKFLRLPP